MKIELKGEGEGNTSTIDVGSMQEVTLRDVFLGIGFETDDGRYGVAMRDTGIEVMLNGKHVWSSSELIDVEGVLLTQGRIQKTSNMKASKGELKNLGISFQSQIRAVLAELVSLKLKYKEEEQRDDRGSEYKLICFGKREAYSYVEKKIRDIFKWFDIEV